MRRHPILLCSLLLPGLCLASEAASDRTLRSMLDAYGAQGVEVISSSALISPGLYVESLPDRNLPAIEQIRELLKPFGLKLKVASDTLVYVVKDASARAQDAPPIPSAAKNERQAHRPHLPIEEIDVHSRYRGAHENYSARHLDQQSLSAIPSPGRDTIRAISSLPGIASNGVGASLRLRGGDSNEVLYLLDGNELIEPFHLRNFQSLFTSLNPNIIESADVYTSGFSVALGSKMSGVVDLQLPRASEPFAANIDVNFISAGLDLRGHFKGVSWLASTRRSTVDTLLDQLDTDYGSPSFRDQTLHLSWEGSHHSFSAGLVNTADRIELIDETNGERGNSRSDFSTAWLNWRTQVDDTTAFTIRLAHSQSSERLRGELVSQSAAGGRLYQNNDYMFTNLSAHWDYQINPDHALAFGMEMRHQRADFTIQRHSQYGELGQALGLVEHNVNTSLGREGWSNALYLDLKSSLSDSLGSTIGLRFDNQNISPLEEYVYSVRARLHYDTVSGSQIYADVGRYAQTQNLHELQLDDGLALLQKPQYSDQLSVGLSHAFQSGIELRSEAYFRYIDSPWSRYDNAYNRWVLLPELQADRIRIEAGNSRIYGAEFSLRQQFRAFSWDMSYTLSRAEDRIGRRWVDRAWNQQHSAKFGMRWTQRDWDVGLQANYHTGWPSTAAVAYPGQLASQLYREQLPDYFSLDLHFGHRIPSNSGEILLYLDILNATNHDNTGGYRYKYADGAYQRSERKLFPMLPVLGMRWSW